MGSEISDWERKTLVAAPYYATVPGHGTIPGYEYIGVLAVDAQTGVAAWHAEIQRFQHQQLADDSKKRYPLAL